MQKVFATQRDRDDEWESSARNGRMEEKLVAVKGRGNPDFSSTYLLRSHQMKFALAPLDNLKYYPAYLRLL